MPNPLIAVAGAGLGSAAVQAGAARRAASSQDAAAQQGADVQRAQVAESARQFDTVRRLLEPYTANGRASMSAQVGQLGLRGPAEQQAAINGILGGPQFGEMVQQGENAILQNASATGGLRGGNTQAALAQFRPQVLNQLLDQRFSQLGGLAAAGQNAAAGVGTLAGQQAQIGQAGANNISQLLQQQGAARAGSSLASGQAFGDALGGIGGLLGRQLPTRGPIIPQDQSLFGRWGF